MSLSFRTNGNFIDFVNTDDTSLQVETVLMSLHNTSRCIDWSLPEDTTKISFTIDEVKYSNIPITEIDFDGTVMNSQDDFETGITGMFSGLDGGSGSYYLSCLQNITQSVSANTNLISTSYGSDTIGFTEWVKYQTGGYENVTTLDYPGSGKTVIMNNPNPFCFAFFEQPNANYFKYRMDAYDVGGKLGVSIEFYEKDTGAGIDPYTIFVGNNYLLVLPEIRVYP